MHSTLKTIAISLVAAASLSISSIVMAVDGATLFKTKTCTACHGQNGDKPIMPLYPKLGGQNAEYLVQQMQDIKSGARSNGMTMVMKGIMGIVTEEEMKTMAQWLASVK
ncbi:MAG: cytochrome c [Thiomargarita sp.]|nr:cytochrome c [Thiomargarita sp.]